MKLTVNVSYIPQHFNRIALCLIPATWTAETFDVPGAYRVYGMDQFSSTEAIKDLIGQLKTKGLSGTLVANRIHTDDMQEQMDEQAECVLANDKLYQSYWA